MQIDSTSRSEQDAAVTLFTVIVLYKLRPQQSPSYLTLLNAASRVGAEKLRIKVLLYDNSPSAWEQGLLPEGVSYERTSENRGLADAYNRALEMAEGENCRWLLTLDQDTTLPEDFLVKLVETIDQVQKSPSVAAVVPQIVDQGRMLSPNYLVLDAIPRFFPKGFIGISARKTFAFNSASTLRISALREVGGYSPLFWLDYCDAYIYSRLNAAGKTIYVAGDIEVEHEFSMFDFKTRVSLERYKNIVNAGCAFWDTEQGNLAGLYHTASLVYRLYKHWKRGDDPELGRVTRDMLKKRLTHSKRHRIEQWKAGTIDR
ncbi:MAG TPA: glycosyltransferase [Terracidiphilus sp.]|nr:glycosyltransferase [Terracidiphilus sp.]